MALFPKPTQKASWQPTVTGPNVARVKAGHEGRRNGTSEPNLATLALAENLGGWSLTLLVAEGEQTGLRLSSRRAGRLASPPGVTYHQVITEPQALTKRCPAKSDTKVVSSLN